MSIDQKFISELRERLENKSLDDLKKIWIENNRDQWAGSTFEVIRQILIERGEEIPPQNEEIPLYAYFSCTDNFIDSWIWDSVGVV